jgi:DNA-binding response OmpR family regulator
MVVSIMLKLPTRFATEKTLRAPTIMNEDRPAIQRPKGRKVILDRTSRIRLLHVDDEASLRRVLRTALAAFGCDVVGVSNGERALALLETSSYDVVLLDLNMPGISGIEVCRRIQALGRRPVVVMFTVNDSEDAKAKAGADDYLVKPVPLRELVARICTAIRNRDMRTS